jgi:hypothetical protein
VSAPTNRLDELKARLAAGPDCRCGDPTCPYETSDLRWAVQEIDYLRFYLAVLGDFAYATDALRWALENPKPGRVERRRRAYEEAQREWLAVPDWRPGECHNGCRRYATHELVIEGVSRTAREPRCEECGRRDVAAWTEFAADHVPPVPARLEPIARQHGAVEGVQG